jgi:dGTPase
MEYKTQVFFYHEGDYFRTRLTHSLEVSQISRSVALALDLNETLAEAVALAHDLGHTPFGHAGERVMDNLMEDAGGFEHNLQSLRVVDLLEDRYPGFAGLNLTWEVREGIAKHSTDYDQPEIAAFGETQPSLEAQIVELADEIAYNNHDLDDGLTSRMLEPEELSRVTLWRTVTENVRSEYADITASMVKHESIRRIINWQVSDLIDNIVTPTNMSLMPRNTPIATVPASGKPVKIMMLRRTVTTASNSSQPLPSCNENAANNSESPSTKK